MTMSEDQEQNQFSVIRARDEDINKKIVRMSDEDIQESGLSTGSVVMLRSPTGKTVGILSIGDVGNGVISVPAMMRVTMGIKENDTVIVTAIQKQNVKVAPRVAIEIKAFGENSTGEIGRDLIKGIEAQFKAMYKGKVPLVNGDMLKVSFPNAPDKSIDVKVSLPDGDVFKISDETAVSAVDKRKAGAMVATSWEDIGGLKSVIETIREMIEIPIMHPEIWDWYTKSPPRGILLKGPPGCGKSMIMRAIASECDATFIPVNASDILSKMLGDTEKAIEKMFKEAKEVQPCVIFIDEVESIIPKRDENLSAVEQRMVSEFLKQMDGLKDLGRVIVVGATNRPNAMDPAARRPGRFEREIEIPPPDEEGRREIFTIHLRGVPIMTAETSSKDNDNDLVKDIVDEMKGGKPKPVASGSTVDIAELARVTHGYVGADIAGMIREAVLKNLKRNLPDIDLKSVIIPPDQLEQLLVSQEDLLAAMAEIQPSAMRSVQVEIPNVSFEDIGGLDDVKQKLKETVIWNTSKKDIVKKVGIRLPKGILLFGPPGSGKTLLGKAVSKESECNFISVKGPEFLSKWVGESEKAVRDVFALAKRVSPCIIFIDEFDSLAPARSSGEGDGTRVTERVVAQLLTEMDGMEAHRDVIVIASTNRPDLIDPAILRKGRIDRIVYVPAPDLEGRKKIVQVHLKGKNVQSKNMDALVGTIAEKTDCFSGADIEALVMEAGIKAIREDRDYISEVDLLFATEHTKPSLDKESIANYDKLNESFNRQVANRGIGGKSTMFS
jgi:transitional endoplasmic reticulum ATPase